MYGCSSQTDGETRLSEQVFPLLVHRKIPNIVSGKEWALCDDIKFKLLILSNTDCKEFENYFKNYFNQVNTNEAYNRANGFSLVLMIVSLQCVNLRKPRLVL